MAGCLPCHLISSTGSCQGVSFLAIVSSSYKLCHPVLSQSLSTLSPFSHYQFALRRKSSLCRPAEQLSPLLSAMYQVTPLSLSASQPSQAVNLACPSALLVQVSPISTYHSRLSNLSAFTRP